MRNFAEVEQSQPTSSERHCADGRHVILGREDQESIRRMTGTGDLKSGTLPHLDLVGGPPKQQTVNNPDGSMVETTRVLGRDRVTGITDAKGNQYSFEYDGNRELVTVKRADGVFRRQRDQDDRLTNVWKKDGDRSSHWEGTVQVDEKGNYSYESADGKTHKRPDGTSLKYDKQGNLTEFSQRDGAVVKEHSNGTVTFEKNGSKTTYHNSQLTIDGAGNVTYGMGGDLKSTHKVDGTELHKQQINGKDVVTQVKDAKGNSVDFEYDANGEVNKVTRADGIYTRHKDEKGFHWTRADKEGREDPNYKWRGTVTVDNEGTYKYINEQGKTVVRTPDGTEVATKPESTKPEVTYTVKAGDTLYTIAAKALKAAHSEDSNYKPNPRDVMAEVKRIAAENQIKDANKIVVNQKLKLG